jgi:Flp pilus assembly protein TadB
MNLDAPVGRTSSRRDKAYAQFTGQLQRSGIDSPHALEGFSRRIARMLGAVAAAVLITTLLLSLLFPRAAFVILIAVALLGAWLAANYARTRSFIRRYRLELAQRRDDDASPNPTNAEENS